jgi:hypothetical protein
MLPLLVIMIGNNMIGGWTALREARSGVVQDDVDDRLDWVAAERRSSEHAQANMMKAAPVMAILQLLAP